MKNVDLRTVEGFGDEWTRFDYADAAKQDVRRIFADYFAVFPWSILPQDAVGFDAGCGTGRWALFVAPKVGMLHCVDASEDALGVARRMLDSVVNVAFHHASIAELPLRDCSMDFGYSLGVLHHVPDTGAAIASCVRKLKPGAPLLLYLYYAFDNRPPWFRSVWRGSDAIRRVVSRLPHSLRYGVSQALAATVYWPLARGARVLERLGVNVEGLPLSAYRNRSFYVMRNDSLDRFGTRLERRFTKAEMRTLMEDAGLSDVRFHDGVPYWCAVGFKKA
jgi:SAM-dependent methyltransferase